MINPEIKGHYFHFKKFSIKQDLSPMKVNTDGVLLGAWSDVRGVETILDVGTGSGVIALMLAQKNSNSTIDAIDIDKKSYLQARYNFEHNLLGKNISCHHQSFQEFSRNSGNYYDLVISNPPYFTSGTPSMKNEKATVRHAIQLSHLELVQGVKGVLKETGYFDVILPHQEGVQFTSIAKKYGLFLAKKVEVVTRTGKPVERLLMRFSFKPTPSFETGRIEIMEGNSKEYSTAYTALTRDFYLFL